MNATSQAERVALLVASCGFALCSVLPAKAAQAPEHCAHWQVTATTQSVMNECSAQAASRSGREVVKSYLAYRDTLATGRRHALDATQRAWAKYRATYCGEKGAAVSGGSMQPLVINVCMDTLNRRRALDLANDRNNR